MSHIHSRMGQHMMKALNIDKKVLKDKRMSVLQTNPVQFLAHQLESSTRRRENTVLQRTNTKLVDQGGDTALD